MIDTAKREARISEIEEQIEQAAAKGDLDAMRDAMAELYELGRADGITDLAIDLWDSKSIEDEGLEFAIENNGAEDPRK